MVVSSLMSTTILITGEAKSPSGNPITTRFGIFYAGIASAQHPKYTVEPQRARKYGHVERS